MAGNKKQRTSKRMIISREREAEAVELRKSGLTYELIGRHMGVTRSAAFKAVDRYMQRLADDAQEGAERIRQLELQRLDEAMAGIYAGVIQGRKDEIELMLKLQARRTKFLGLDVPEQQETTLEVLPWQD